MTLGSGTGTSLNDLVEHLPKITERGVIRDLKSTRAVDMPVSILDCNAAERAFGWKATHNLDVGLETACKWILAVTSRTVVWLFLEQFWFEFVPIFHRLQGRLAGQC